MIAADASTLLDGAHAVMDDLVYPALHQAGPAEVTIRDLARKHGVAYKPTPLDVFATDASRLSDAEVTPDVVEDLLQVLARAGAVPARESILLLADYLRERQDR